MTAFEHRNARRKPSRPVPQSRNRIICDRTANTAATLDGGPWASDVFTPGRDRPEGHGVAPGVHAVRRWRASPGETGLRKRAPAAHVTDVTSTAPPSGWSWAAAALSSLYASLSGIRFGDGTSSAGDFDDRGVG